MPLSNYAVIEQVIQNDLDKALKDGGVKASQRALVTETTLYLVKKVLESSQFYDRYGYGTGEDHVAS